MTVRRYGERGALIETDHPIRLAAALRRAPEVVEVVPAAATVLVVYGPATADPVAAATAHSQLGARAADSAEDRADRAGDPVVLSIRYDGPDLIAVAAECGLSVDQVVNRHLAGRYVVAFCGFAPGFAYLTGLDPALTVARLAEPRTRVPAGALGLAGQFTGMYPRPSPGGWRLIGRTDTALWDTSARPPALLSPGTAVRFELR